MSGIFRSGQRKLVKLAVAQATVVARNDMLAYPTSTDEVVGAGDFQWDTDLATTQGNFADVFVGIAYEASASDESDDISVDVSADAVYEFDVASATYVFGDDLGPDKASGNSLLDQTLEAVSSNTNAIAKAAEKTDSASTRLRVTFASAFWLSANNTNAVVG